MNSEKRKPWHPTVNQARARTRRIGARQRRDKLRAVEQERRARYRKTGESE